jgi:hypothetical protein
MGPSQENFPVEVEHLQIAVLANYVDNMSRLHNSKNKKGQEEATNLLLSLVKRPANLFPMVRLLFPGVWRTA